MLLFDAVVLAFPDLLHPQSVAIEPEARLRVVDDNRRMVDAKKQLRAAAMPFGVAFVRRKREDFERMFIGILEVEGLDSGSILIPLRQRLRTRGCMFDLVLTQPG